MIVANLFGFGNPVELAIIATVVMVLFGASKVGQFGKSLGEGLKEFKKATHDEPDPAAQPTQTITPAASATPIESAKEPEEAIAKTPDTKE